MGRYRALDTEKVFNGTLSGMNIRAFGNTKKEAIKNLNNEIKKAEKLDIFFVNNYETR